MMDLLIATAAAPEKSPLKWLLGAFHPGIVHFPIALLAVAALLELIQILKKRKEPAGGTLALAYLSAASALPAALFGFMLADTSGTEGTTVEWHKWLGVATTVVAVAAAGCSVKSRSCAGSLIGLRVSLILGAALVLATGYLGGELTAGENHLIDPLKAFFGIAKTPNQVEKPAEQPLLIPSSSKIDFVKDIAPIIQADCFKCHGGEKVKGKLKLNTKALAMGPSESGKPILPGKPSISKFYTSLIDPDVDVLMPPPKEKARPTKEQIEKVRKWIEEGAEWPDSYEFKK